MVPSRSLHSFCFGLSVDKDWTVSGLGWRPYLMPSRQFPLSLGGFGSAVVSLDSLDVLRDRCTRRQGARQQGIVPGGAAGEAREMKLSLQRTRKMMAEQLERVAQVSEIVGEQDALLRDTFAQHKVSGTRTEEERGLGSVRRMEKMSVLDGRLDANYVSGSCALITFVSRGSVNGGSAMSSRPCLRRIRMRMTWSFV